MINGDCCSSDSPHPSHRNQLSRLNRISGQVEGVKRMIDEQRYCPEILTQLRAIRSAVKSLESEVLKTHLNTCVVDVLSSNNKKKRAEQIEELTEIFQKFG